MSYSHVNMLISSNLSSWKSIESRMELPPKSLSDKIEGVVEEWDSGYSNIVETNLLVSAQNLYVQELTAREKLLIQNAESIEELDSAAAEASHGLTNLESNVGSLESEVSRFSTAITKIDGQIQEQQEAITLLDEYLTETHLHKLGSLGSSSVDTYVYTYLTAVEGYSYNGYGQVMSLSLSAESIKNIKTAITSRSTAANNILTLMDNSKKYSEIIDTAEGLIKEYNTGIKNLSNAVDTLDNEKITLAGLQEQAYNEYTDLVEKGVTLEGLTESAKDIMGELSKDKLAELGTVSVEAKQFDSTLEEWFEGRFNEAVAEGADKTPSSGTIGMVYTNKDTGYGITLNEKYFDEQSTKLDKLYGDMSSVNVDEYIDTSKEFTLLHEKQHLYQKYFTPLSLTAYEYTESAGYSRDSSMSTTWAEDAANIYAGLKSGQTIIDKQGDAFVKISSGGLQITKDIVSDEDYLTIMDQLDKQFDTPDLLLEDNPMYEMDRDSLIGEGDMAYSMWTLLKRRRARQAKRGE